MHFRENEVFILWPACAIDSPFTIFRPHIVYFSMERESTWKVSRAAAGAREARRPTGRELRMRILIGYDETPGAAERSRTRRWLAFRRPPKPWGSPSPTYSCRLRQSKNTSSTSTPTDLNCRRTSRRCRAIRRSRRPSEARSGP